MSVTTFYKDTENLQTSPSYLLGLMNPHFRAFQFFTLPGSFLFIPERQVGWSYWILICERNKLPLYLTWVLFALPGIGSLLHLQGGLAFNLCVIATCLHQDRGMPQQDKMLWNFRLLLFASSKGNNVLATHVELPVASMETFCRPKATRPVIFATPKMQIRDQQVKGWILNFLLKFRSCWAWLA